MAGNYMGSLKRKLGLRGEMKRGEMITRMNLKKKETHENHLSYPHMKERDIINKTKKDRLSILGAI